MTDLVHAQDADGALSEDDIVLLLAGLIGAGSETTSQGGASIVRMLLAEPRAMERLRGDRALIRRAIDEIIRFTFSGPGGTVRFALRDFELRGKAIRRGQMLMLSLGGANRDPAVFENPDVLDLDRPVRDLPAFGNGPHYCLGANLARQEMACMLDALLDVVPPGSRCATTGSSSSTSGLFRRATNLPVEIGPRPRRRALKLRPALAKAFLRLSGWALEGARPVPRGFVLIAAPHTTNWDLLYFLAHAWAFGISPSWMGKHTLFRGPLGPVMRWLGGVPVTAHARAGSSRSWRRRSSATPISCSPCRPRARAAAPRTGSRASTRSRAPRSVPIVMGFLDYDRRRGGLGPTADARGRPARATWTRSARSTPTSAASIPIASATCGSRRKTPPNAALNWLRARAPEVGLSARANPRMFGPQP